MLVDSLCSVRVFKLFSRSIHYSYVMLINHGRSPWPINDDDNVEDDDDHNDI